MRFALILALFFTAFAPSAEARDLGVINFDFDSDVLDAAALAEIDRIAADLKANPSYLPTVVVGYTDAVGGQSYNQDLGLRRARAAANALIAAGVPVTRIGTIESKGKTELLVSVSTPERRNRRVRVTLEDILAACRSYREIDLTTGALGPALENDLEQRRDEAVAAFATLVGSGNNGPAYQMAGAAREDCGTAVGYGLDDPRKLEYAQRCFCNSARLQVALGG